LRYSRKADHEAGAALPVRPVLDAAKTDGFGFDVELLYLARKANLRMREIPVRWNHYEGSKVNVLRDSVRMVREVAEIRFSEGRASARP
jgi:dolichyl-phosphate beta-glucosyltransferase